MYKQMSDNRIKVGITQGDTNGIGWEVIIKTLADNRMTELCTPVIYGSPKVASFYKSRMTDVDGFAYNAIRSASQARRGKINLIDCGQADIEITPGVASEAAGKAAVAALRAAVTDLKAGDIDVLVTAPINKESVQSESFHYTGHTEFLADELSGEPMMIMCSELLRVGLVTIHIPLADVSRSLSEEKIVASLQRLRKTLKSDFGVVEPRIAVLALNPHAGDGGLLGNEEQLIIGRRSKRLLLKVFSPSGHSRPTGSLQAAHSRDMMPFWRCITTRGWHRSRRSLPMGLTLRRHFRRSAHRPTTA